MVWCSQKLFMALITTIACTIIFLVIDINSLSAVLVGALNDRLLLANPTDVNPRQKKGVEIKSCLVGLLEPLLIGFATMQHTFEQKLDLSEILYQITSRSSSLLHKLSFVSTGISLHYETKPCSQRYIN